MSRRASALFILFCTTVLWPKIGIALSFEQYHGASDVQRYLWNVAQTHPEIATLEYLGTSDEQRAIYLIKLAQRSDRKREAIYINGTHHGNEKASTESALALIDYILENRDSVFVQQLLDRYELFIQPIVNPDGFVRGVRDDGFGRDPNRNYAAAEGSGFSISSVRIVRDLLEKYKFRASLALHSGMEGILWPSCSTPEAPKDDGTFRQLAGAMAQAMGMRRFMQSFFDYPANGEFIEFAYERHGVLALTVEVAHAPAPPARDLARVVKRATEGAVAFFETLMTIDQNQRDGQLAGLDALMPKPRVTL